MNDRVSMAYSRELRQPLIDHRLVEHAFRLPGRQKIRGGQGKFLLRHAMRRDLPDDVRGTPKRFVVTPQREWLAGPLAGAVTDIIESREFRERGLFDVAEVRRAWKKFRGGDSKNAFFVWQWVNTELWFRRFADGRGDILNVA
jgi:asparagine synthase (glutamine-hydrolysing)